MSERRVQRLTPPGRGPLAVLAWTGPWPGDQLTTPRGAPLEPLAPGAFRRAHLRDEQGVLDEVLVIGRPGGGELCLHGSEALVSAACRLLGGVSADGPVAPAAPASLREARARASATDGPLAELLARVRARGGRPAPALRAEVAAVLARVGLARRLACVPVVRLVGRPNAGKSTLFNALLGADRALTSPAAGTTRDTVVARLALAGIPVQLEDSAGGWDPAAAGDGADLVVHLLGGPQEAGQVPGALEVLGKADLSPSGALGGLPGVSGRTGQGLGPLLSEVTRRLGLEGSPEDDARAPLAADLRAELARFLDTPSGS